MLPGRLRKTSLWSPLGHLKMRCSCLTLVCCEDKELCLPCLFGSLRFSTPRLCESFITKSNLLKGCNDLFFLCMLSQTCNVATLNTVFINTWNMEDSLVCICYGFCFRCRSQVSLFGPPVIRIRVDITEIHPLIIWRAPFYTREFGLRLE